MSAVQKKPVTKRDLRQFGIGVAVFGLLAGGLLVRAGHAWGYLAAVAGSLFGAVCWLAWPGARQLYDGWMKLAGQLSRLMTGVLLSALYLLLLTPIALLARICGQTFLDTRFRVPEKASYWQPRSADDDPRRAEKQS